MATTITFHQLPLQSLPNTRMALITEVELSETVAATAQEFRVTIPANSEIEDIILDVRKPPIDDSDSAFDDITVSVGDSASATTFLAATQVAANNGSVIRFARMNKATQTGKAYTAANYLSIVVTPEAGKSLSNIDRAEIRVYVSYKYPGQLG